MVTGAAQRAYHWSLWQHGWLNYDGHGGWCTAVLRDIFMTEHSSLLEEMQEFICWTPRRPSACLHLLSAKWVKATSLCIDVVSVQRRWWDWSVLSVGMTDTEPYLELYELSWWKNKHIPTYYQPIPSYSYSFHSRSNVSFAWTPDSLRDITADVLWVMVLLFLLLSSPLGLFSGTFPH